MGTGLIDFGAPGKKKAPVQQKQQAPARPQSRAAAPAAGGFVASPEYTTASGGASGTGLINFGGHASAPATQLAHGNVPIGGPARGPMNIGQQIAEVIAQRKRLGQLGGGGGGFGGFLGHLGSDVTNIATGLPAMAEFGGNQIGSAAAGIALPAVAHYSPLAKLDPHLAAYLHHEMTKYADYGNKQAAQVGRGAVTQYKQSYGPTVRALIAGHPGHALGDLVHQFYMHPANTALDAAAAWDLAGRAPGLLEAGGKAAAAAAAADKARAGAAADAWRNARYVQHSINPAGRTYLGKNQYGPREVPLVGRRVRGQGQMADFASADGTGTYKAGQLLSDPGWSKNPLTRGLQKFQGHIAGRWQDASFMPGGENNRLLNYLKGQKSSVKALERGGRNLAQEISAEAKSAMRNSPEMKTFVKSMRKLGRGAEANFQREVVYWRSQGLDSQQAFRNAELDYRMAAQEHQAIDLPNGHINDQADLFAKMASDPKYHSPEAGSPIDTATNAAKAFGGKEKLAAQKALGMTKEQMDLRASMLQELALNHRIMLPDLGYYQKMTDGAFNKMSDAAKQQHGNEILNMIREQSARKTAAAEQAARSDARLADGTATPNQNFWSHGFSQLHHSLHGELVRQAQDYHGIPLQQINDATAAGHAEATTMERMTAAERQAAHELQQHLLSQASPVHADLAPEAVMPQIQRAAQQGQGIDEFHQAQQMLANAHREHAFKQDWFPVAGQSWKFYDTPRTPAEPHPVDPNVAVYRQRSARFTSKPPSKWRSMKSKLVPQDVKRNLGRLYRQGDIKVEPMRLVEQYHANLMQIGYNNAAGNLLEMAAARSFDPARGTWEIHVAPKHTLEAQFAGQNVRLIPIDEFVNTYSKLSQDPAALEQMQNLLSESTPEKYLPPTPGINDNQRYIAVSGHAADEWERALGLPGGGELGRKFDLAQGLWKDAVLALSPRWYTHVTVGHFLQYALLSGPRDILSIVRAGGPETRAAIEKYLPGIHTGLGQETTGRLTQSWISALFRFNDRIQTRIRMGAAISSARKIMRDEQMGQIGLKMTDAQIAQGFEKLAANPVLREETLRLALRFVGDYIHFNQTERNVMKRIFPFYSWLRVISRLALALPVHHPLTAEAVSIIGQASEHVQNPLDPLLPVTERSALDTGNIAWGTSSSNPLGTIADWTSGLAGPGNWQDKLTNTATAIGGGSESPFLQMLAAWQTRINPFTGQPYTAPTGYGGSAAPFGSTPEVPTDLGTMGAMNPMPDFLQQVESNVVPWDPAIRGLLSIGAPGHPYDTTSNLQLLLNQIKRTTGYDVGAGQPVNDYMPPSRTGGSGVVSSMLEPLGSLFLGFPPRTVNPQQVIRNAQTQNIRYAKGLRQNQRTRLKQRLRLQASPGLPTLPGQTP